MKAMVATDQAAGTAGGRVGARPEPQAAINDVVVQIHASGFTGDELTWPSTWTDRVGRDRTPSIPRHELAGAGAGAGAGRRHAPCAGGPEGSPLSAVARRGCRLDSGCSASRTGIATARWRSM